MGFNLKSKFFLAVCTLLPFVLPAQQLPFFAQYMSSSLLYNPAVAGTKKTMDIRTSYRNQWTGFDGAPQTEYISLNARLLSGRFGLAGYTYKDDTGPTSRMNYSANIAAHLRFPDVEASFGLSGSLFQYRVNGNKMTLETPGDIAIDQNASKVINVPSVGMGFYLYNDRFNVGISAMNTSKSELDFYSAKDNVKRDKATLDPHVYFSFGYNFSATSDYVWENSFFSSYVRSSPFSLGYSLRLFYKNKFIVGSSLRIKEAIAIHLGYIISEKVQICYSYDFVAGNFNKSVNGSHEILLATSIGGPKKRKTKNEEFQRQKYKYMF